MGSDTSWIFMFARHERRSLAQNTAQMSVVTALDVERVFRDAGALRDGHFILASGRHSATYLEKFQVLQRPRETERLCAAIADWARPLDVATVAGPTTGGIILAHEVARQLGARAVYAERPESGKGREFRRGFQLAPGERVLVVDDIMTTGGSVQETIGAVREGSAVVAGAAVLVDRSGGAASLDVPVRALWRLDIPTYAPADCPLCAAGVPAEHPGTTPAPSGAR
jgi:orotate phosphoribosyltransferase